MRIELWLSAHPRYLLHRYCDACSNIHIFIFCHHSKWAFLVQFSVINSDGSPCPYCILSHIEFQWDAVETEWASHICYSAVITCMGYPVKYVWPEVTAKHSNREREELCRWCHFSGSLALSIVTTKWEIMNFHGNNTAARIALWGSGGNGNAMADE